MHRQQCASLILAPKTDDHRRAPKKCINTIAWAIWIETASLERQQLRFSYLSKCWRYCFTSIWLGWHSVLVLDILHWFFLSWRLLVSSKESDILDENITILIIRTSISGNSAFQNEVWVVACRKPPKYANSGGLERAIHPWFSNTANFFSLFLPI